MSVVAVEPVDAEHAARQLDSAAAELTSAGNHISRVLEGLPGIAAYMATDLLGPVCRGLFLEAGELTALAREVRGVTRTIERAGTDGVYRMGLPGRPGVLVWDRPDIIRPGPWQSPPPPAGLPPTRPGPDWRPRPRLDPRVRQRSPTEPRVRIPGVGVPERSGSLEGRPGGVTSPGQDGVAGTGAAPSPPQQPFDPGQHVIALPGPDGQVFQFIALGVAIGQKLGQRVPGRSRPGESSGASKGSKASRGK